MEIEELIEGEWVSETEYLIRCPFCGDHPIHNHCYVNVKKRIFFCHYHGEGGSLRKLMDELEISETEFEPRQGITEKKKFSLIDFSKFKEVTGVENSNDRLALSYLKKRGINEDEIKFYDIRYCSDTTNSYYGRVIIPVFENGEMVCLSARSFLPFIKPPYLFPHHKETKCTAGEIIFGFDRFRLQGGGAVVLVEGVFDAIAINQKENFERHGLALMSNAMAESKLSGGQLGKLLTLGIKEFFVMLDSDAKKQSLKIARKLFNYGRQVYVCRLDEGDPASISKEQYFLAIDNAKIFSNEMEMEEVL